MRIALIADVYPPFRSSGAVQLRDLSREFVKHGHETTVLVATPDLDTPWRIESLQGVRIVRLRAPRTKGVGHMRRAIGEFLMPFTMLHSLRNSPLAIEKWDGIVWYSPTIFLGFLAKALKSTSRCRCYLIIRDIFPECAVDIGVMSKGLPYLFFKAIARYQYSVADVIGVQTPGDLINFKGQVIRQGGRVEVLQNWLADAPKIGCSININNTPLAGRTIFVYAGNMGIAQGMGILLDLAEKLRSNARIGFLFVGRGSEKPRLRTDAAVRGLDNVLFFDEIDPEEIPGLYSQCHIGMVALDPRHKTHNIPGKFLSYMQSGIPVLACINPGNDLVDLIESARVGRACTDATVACLKVRAEALLDDIAQDGDISARCKALSARFFSPDIAAKQIIKALS